MNVGFIFLLAILTAASHGQLVPLAPILSGAADSVRVRARARFPTAPRACVRATQPPLLLLAHAGRACGQRSRRSPPPPRVADGTESALSCNARAQARLLGVMKTNWVVWPIPSFVNIYLVPLQYRVLFMNVVSITYNAALSLVVHKK